MNGKVISVIVDDNPIFRAFQGILSVQLEGSGQITNTSPVADPSRRYVYAASPNGLIHKLSVNSGREARAVQNIGGIANVTFLRRGATLEDVVAFDTGPGNMVIDGVVHRRDRVRLQRAGQQLWEGGIASLRRFKDDVNEVREGFECGITLDGWDDLTEGDRMEMFSSERI